MEKFIYMSERETVCTDVSVTIRYSSTFRILSHLRIIMKTFLLFYDQKWPCFLMLQLRTFGRITSFSLTRTANFNHSCPIKFFADTNGMVDMLKDTHFYKSQTIGHAAFQPETCPHLFLLQPTWTCTCAASSSANVFLSGGCAITTGNGWIVRLPVLWMDLGWRLTWCSRMRSGSSRLLYGPIDQCLLLVELCVGPRIWGYFLTGQENMK